MKKTRTIICALIAIVLILFLVNPHWLPISKATAEAIRELELEHMLIRRSG